MADSPTSNPPGGPPAGPETVSSLSSQLRPLFESCEGLRGKTVEDYEAMLANLRREVVWATKGEGEAIYQTLFSHRDYGDRVQELLGSSNPTDFFRDIILLVIRLRYLHDFSNHLHQETGRRLMDLDLESISIDLPPEVNSLIAQFVDQVRSFHGVEEFVSSAFAPKPDINPLLEILWSFIQQLFQDLRKAAAAYVQELRDEAQKRESDEAVVAQRGHASGAVEEAVERRQVRDEFFALVEACGELEGRSLEEYDAILDGLGDSGLSLAWEVNSHGEVDSFVRNIASLAFSPERLGEAPLAALRTTIQVWCEGQCLPRIAERFSRATNGVITPSSLPETVLPPFSDELRDAIAGLVQQGVQGEALNTDAFRRCLVVYINALPSVLFQTEAAWVLRLRNKLAEEQGKPKRVLSLEGEPELGKAARGVVAEVRKSLDFPGLAERVRAGLTFHEWAARGLSLPDCLQVRSQIEHLQIDNEKTLQHATAVVGMVNDGGRVSDAIGEYLTRIMPDFAKLFAFIDQSRGLRLFEFNRVALLAPPSLITCFEQRRSCASGTPNHETLVGILMDLAQYCFEDLQGTALQSFQALNMPSEAPAATPPPLAAPAPVEVQVPEQVSVTLSFPEHVQPWGKENYAAAIASVQALSYGGLVEALFQHDLNVGVSLRVEPKPPLYAGFCARMGVYADVLRRFFNAASPACELEGVSIEGYDFLKPLYEQFRDLDPFPISFQDERWKVLDENLNRLTGQFMQRVFEEAKRQILIRLGLFGLFREDTVPDGIAPQKEGRAEAPDPLPEVTVTFSTQSPESGFLSRDEGQLRELHEALSALNYPDFEADLEKELRLGRAVLPGANLDGRTVGLYLYYRQNYPNNLQYFFFSTLVGRWPFLTELLSGLNFAGEDFPFDIQDFKTATPMDKERYVLILQAFLRSLFEQTRVSFLDLVGDLLQKAEITGPLVVHFGGEGSQSGQTSGPTSIVPLGDVPAGVDSENGDFDFPPLDPAVQIFFEESPGFLSSFMQRWRREIGAALAGVGFLALGALGARWAGLWGSSDEQGAEQGAASSGAAPAPGAKRFLEWKNCGDVSLPGKDYRDEDGSLPNCDGEEMAGPNSEEPNAAGVLFMACQDWKVAKSVDGTYHTVFLSTAHDLSAAEGIKFSNGSPGARLSEGVYTHPFRFTAKSTCAENDERTVWAIPLVIDPNRREE